MNIVNRTYCNSCHHSNICKNKREYEALQKEVEETINTEISSKNSDMWIVLEERCAYYEEIGQASI